MIAWRPVLNPFLARLGIHARQFWILSDLFQSLTDRRELYGQLGREGLALKAVLLLYLLFTGVTAMLWSLAQPPAGRFLSGYLSVTGFLLFSILLAETGNSLVNATEALVLAHQPIRGLTYTAAKLSHLGRLVLQLALAMNGVPAVVGLTLPGADWLYPLRHMGLAIAIGIVSALASCAIYGWLLRFAPPQRLKALSSLIEAMPLLLIAFTPPSVRQLFRFEWLPSDPRLLALLLALVAVLCLTALIFGLRALSTDFLLRVATVVHGGRTRTWTPRMPFSPGSLAAAVGGQPARAAYGYLAALLRRDYQFRRQLLSMSVALLVPFAGILGSLHDSPFGPRFAPAHGLPHLLGLVLFLVCSALPYGNQPQAAWVFLLVPPGAWPRFAQGIHSLLWSSLVMLPHAILLAASLRFWPAGDSFLFTGYSLALSSLYLAANLLILEHVPFTRPFQPDRGAMLLPALFAGGLFVGIAVALQYFLVFRSRLAVPVATIALAIAAMLATRWVLARLAVSMQFGLAQQSGEVTSMYTEID